VTPRYRRSVDEREFYRRHSPYSAAESLPALPADVAALSELVRGVVVHRDETAQVFGFDLPVERRDEAQARHVGRILDVLGDLRPRPAEDRFAGTCRDFSILLCALLREAAVPARLRCGFAGYFFPGFFADHWVVEYWSGERGWLLADAQITGAGRAAYPVPFDPADVPRDQFLVAGRAWAACRAGERDPAVFGVAGAGLSGMTEIQGNVVRDLAALNRVEVLPWDDWGVIERPFADLTEAELTLLDRAAEIGERGGPLADAAALYGSNAALRPPTLSTSA
jgi:transglutaminase-like putative cysteine protease